MGWNLNDLASSADAPAAAGNPTGFVVPARGTQHVFYRGTDNRVYELRWDRSGWRRVDLVTSLKAPLAAGDPAPLLCMRAGTKHVFYAGVDGHVHELTDAGHGFRHEDISGSAPQIQGTPSACVLERKGTRHVFFRDAAGRVHELAQDGQSFRHADLSAATNAPAAAGNLASQVHDATGARFVIYKSADGHLQELREGGSGWQASDLTAIAQGAPNAAGDPVAYTFDATGTRHVAYRGTDGHIHELRHDEKGWRHEDLSKKTGAPDAAGDPSAYMFNLQGTQHVLFVAADQRVHELWSDVNGWHHDAPGAIGPAATGRPAGYSFEMQKTQHAIYRQPDGRIAELWWHPDGTGTGGAAKNVDGKSISMKWDPIVFDGGIPVSGSAELRHSTEGRWEFTGHFHDSGFSPFEVGLLFAIRTSKGALFTFASEGSVSGTLGTGTRDFKWNVSGTDGDIKAAWGDLQAGYSWQAQSGTGAEWGGLWAEVKGALGEINSITSVVGPLFS
jgi:hypothetical protein